MKKIIYKVINESDTIFARSVMLEHDVHLYKLKTTNHQTKKIFLSMAKEINKLYKKPRWFDTFTNNCITRAIKHLREGGVILPKWHISYTLTTNIDRLLFSKNVIDTDEQDFEKLKLKSNISHIARKFNKDPELSKKAREYLRD